MEKKLKMPVRMDAEGAVKRLVPAWNGMIAVQMKQADGDAWYLADFQKGKLRKTDYEDFVPFDWKSGYGWVRCAGDDRYRLMDGKRDTGIRVCEAGEFSEGLAWFRNEAGLYGYYTADGVVAIEPQYTRAEDFYNGYACVYRDGSYARIDKHQHVYDKSVVAKQHLEKSRQAYVATINGKETDIRTIYKEAGRFIRNIALVKDNANCYHYINRYGICLKAKGLPSAAAAFDFEADFVPMKTATGRWQIVDRNLQPASETGYSGVQKMAGFACVAEDGEERYLIDLRAANEQQMKTMQSLSAFGGEWLQCCGYDDSADPDKQKLDAMFCADGWLRCECVQLAEDILYDYLHAMGKEARMAKEEAWSEQEEDGSLRCARYYMLLRQPGGKEEATVKLVYGKEGVFLRMYHRQYISLEDMARRTSVCRASLPRVEKSLRGAAGQNVPDETRRQRALSGGYESALYAYETYARMEEALDAFVETQQTACGFDQEEILYESRLVLLRDAVRPWGNTLRIPGGDKPFASAVFYDTQKLTIEVYLSRRYSDWYSGKP